jgi:hypothetical protein
LLASREGIAAVAAPVARGDRPAHPDGPWFHFARSSQALILASASGSSGSAGRRIRSLVTAPSRE